MKNEDGFNFLEFPCKSGKPDMLIVFFHGYSNHPEMFAELHKRFQKKWPNADVLLVRGPEALHASQERKDAVGVPDVEDLYSWYKVNSKARDNLALALSHFFNRVPVVDELNTFVDKQLAKRSLKDDSLVLYGFSLGGAIALQMATRRPEQCAAVIAHSSPVFPIVKPQSKPDTMLLMGDEDSFFYTRVMEVKKPNHLKRAFDKAIQSISVHYDSSLKRLKKAGVKAKGVVVKGLGHTISEESLRHTLDFIDDHVKKPPAPKPPKNP